MSLVKAIVASRESKASNLSDKVYALLGVSSDGSDLVPLPNHNLPVEAVFRELARNIWTMKGRVYSSMLLIRPSEREPQDSLPTWAPYWFELSNMNKPWLLEALDSKTDQYLEEIVGFMFGRADKYISKLNLDSFAVLHRNKLGSAASSLLKTQKKMYKTLYLLSQVRLELDTLVREGYVLGTIDRLTSRMRENLSQPRPAIPPRGGNTQSSPISKSRKENDIETTKAVLMSFCMINDGPDFLSSSPRLFGPDFLRFTPSSTLLGKLLSSKGSQLMEILQPSLLQWFNENQDFNLGTRKLGPIDSWGPVAKDRMLHMATSQIRRAAFGKGEGQDVELTELINHVAGVLRTGMRLMVTTNGKLGMVHAQARRGDKIVRIEHCSMPAIMRRYGDGYLVVGEAYLSANRMGQV